MPSLPTIVPRQELLQTISRHIQEAAQRQRILGLVLCDIRGFRRINDLYGFDVGDNVICELNSRLKPMAKTTEGIMRTGGNEFAFILPLMENPIIAQLAANKAARLLEQESYCGQRAISCKAALGVGVMNPAELSPTELCLLAESALHQAKASTQQIVVRHDHQQERHKAQLEVLLEYAQNNDELELFYQPKINLHTNCPSQSEALIRWRRNSNQYIPPNEFIPAAENLGLIQPMTRWIVHNALRSMQNYPQELDQNGVSINISGASLEAHDFCSLIEHALKLWNIEPERLTLEITESVFMENLENTMIMFADLRNRLGIRISIDDFGTGYSSLAYFKHIPADELKIDQSFIKDLKNNHSDQKIVELTIQLAKSFKLDIVAEGVEDKETLDMVKHLGCDYAQGYYFSKPLRLEEYIPWTQNHLLGRNQSKRFCPN